MAATPLLFQGIIALIMEQGLGKARKGILIKQIQEKGGQIVNNNLTSEVTHVIVNSTMKYERLLSLLKVESVPSHVHVVNADWISTSIINGKLAEMTSFVITPPTTLSSPEKGCGQSKTNKLSDFVSSVESSPVKTTPTSPITTPIKSTQSTPTKEKDYVSPLKRSPGEYLNKGKRKLATTMSTAISTVRDSDSDYIESDDDDEKERGEIINPESLTQQGLIRPAPKKGRWMCQIPATELQSLINHNEHVTNKLEELLLEYKNSSLPKDKWRAMSLTKAIAAIKRHPKEITTYEEAHSLPFVGKRLADKIFEIVSSGHLRRLDHIDKNKQTVIDLFKGIHGVGQIVAEQFYAQGYRTLQDLRDANILNRQQQIGLKYYDDFAERMQRSEVEEIEGKVREGCQLLDSDLMVVTCGSFRRGKPTCGDVDILITHPDGRSHKGIFSRLLKILKNNEFLTDDLTTHEDPNDGSCKYFGVCRLPGEGQKHRRIDIYICPYAEYPLMLLHFTGSGHFNRSLRNRADKMGMSLSEHSLNGGVIRKNGVKVFDGTPLPVFSESDIFKYLGVDYLEPHDRDLD